MTSDELRNGHVLVTSLNGGLSSLAAGEVWRLTYYLIRKFDPGLDGTPIGSSDSLSYSINRTVGVAWTPMDRHRRHTSKYVKIKILRDPVVNREAPNEKGKMSARHINNDKQRTVWERASVIVQRGLEGP